MLRAKCWHCHGEDVRKGELALNTPAVLTDGRTPFEIAPPWPDAKSTGRWLAFARWPTHPELLNWLATEFVLQRWSLKERHRLMMTSSLYRLASKDERREQDALAELSTLRRSRQSSPLPHAVAAHGS